jgi:hypothetical protein
MSPEQYADMLGKAITILWVETNVIAEHILFVALLAFICGYFIGKRKKS